MCKQEVYPKDLEPSFTNFYHIKRDKNETVTNYRCGPIEYKTTETEEDA